jgi:protein SCO1/2
MTRRTLPVPAPLSAKHLAGGLRVACGAAVALAVALLLGAAPAQAQRSGQDIEAFEGVKLNQKLGSTVPGDLSFRNAKGEEVQISRYFNGERPVILNLVYHRCRMLCKLMLKGLTRTLGEMDWTPGGKFEVLTVSFNKREGPKIAREKKKTAVANLGRPKATEGWHFLTGSEESIQRLTQAVGFNFKWIARKKQFAHPSTVIFLSGDREITRYLGGVNPDAGDTRKALVEASNGQVGNVLDQVVARCFQYDPDSNSYVADAFNIMRLGSILFAALLGGGLLVFWRRERDRQNDSEDDSKKEEERSQWGASWNDALERETQA